MNLGIYFLMNTILCLSLNNKIFIIKINLEFLYLLYFLILFIDSTNSDFIQSRYHYIEVKIIMNSWSFKPFYIFLIIFKSLQLIFWALYKFLLVLQDNIF